MLGILRTEHITAARLDLRHDGVDLFLVLDQVFLSEVLVRSQISVGLERLQGKW